MIDPRVLRMKMYILEGWSVNLSASKAGIKRTEQSAYYQNDGDYRELVDAHSKRPWLRQNKLKS